MSFTKIHTQNISETGVTAGTYTNPILTVNAQGQVTGASSGQLAQGIQGLQGIQGPQSTQGIQGSAGYIGADGAQGIQGTAGFQGISGQAGPAVPFATYTYTGNGSTTTFAGVNNITVDNILVLENGVTQTPTTDYTVSGSNVVFTTAPANGVNIQIRILGGFPGIQGTNGLVGSQGSQGTQGVQGLDGLYAAQGIQGTAGQGVGSIFLPFETFNYTANGSTATFTAANNITLDGIIVTLNGIMQRPTTDYTVSGNQVTLTSTPRSGVVIQIRVLSGYYGPQGIQGVQGLIGSQGFGYAQLQGVQGIQGVQGVQGVQGDLGIQGTQGLQGIQGIQSLQGIQGVQGFGYAQLQGVQGLQGIQGILGNTPSIQTETTNLLTSSTGVVTHNYNTGGLWIHTSISANFTANFTNVPTTDNRIHNFTLILYQGATAYYPSAVQIDGVAQTILWFEGNTPVPVANKTDIVSFSLIRVASAWRVLGSFGTHG
jgi:hypothetical protein